MTGGIRRLKSSGVVTLALGALLGGALVWAPTAAAVAPSCTGSESTYDGKYIVSIPHGFDTAADRFTTACTLHQGATGYGVRALQRNMNYCYKTGLEVDGKFGAATFAAVKSVQRRVGVTVDGKYGPQTMKAMKWAHWLESTAQFVYCS
ncbi:peptidoglycan-binding protein [Streptomyces sp. 130]|uniref:peptidoglycan-binding domain-containing protein n=1 Tax=Streptomyces sp. 130 TaxID=2591006 RepID=UPI00117D92BB|nr:peptidoglycan-binding domain-containing protein [Streptomyces sp. 130]TRV75445.1 peptidoglycan-binding protein [Streptomyces sp. 130]